MKSHSSYKTCVPLRKEGWHAGMCLLWEGPLLLYGASAKGGRCLKFILLRNISPYFSCLLHNTKQKTSSFLASCCLHKSGCGFSMKQVLPWHVHVSSVKIEGGSKCAPGLLHLLPCVPFTQQVRRGRFVHGSCHSLVPGCGHGQS